MLRPKQVLKVLSEMTNEKLSRWIHPIFALLMVTSFGMGIFLGYESENNSTVITDGVEAMPISEKATPMVRIVAPIELAPVVLQETTIDPPEMVTQYAVYYDCPLDRDLQDYIRYMCGMNELPMSLVIALISVESSFQSNVISDTNDYGLMQINTINHEWLSEEYGITNFLDPHQNIFCGITILSQHYDKYQDIDKALMAYNLGATGAKRMWDKGTYETTYTNKVRAAMEVYDNEIK